MRSSTTSPLTTAAFSRTSAFKLRACRRCRTKLAHQRTPQRGSSPVSREQDIFLPRRQSFAIRFQPGVEHGSNPGRLDDFNARLARLHCLLCERQGGRVVMFWPDWVSFDHQPPAPGAPSLPRPHPSQPDMCFAELTASGSDVRRFEPLPSGAVAGVCVIQAALCEQAIASMRHHSKSKERCPALPSSMPLGGSPREPRSSEAPAAASSPPP